MALTTKERGTILSTFDKIDALLKQKGKKQSELTAYLGIKKNRYTDWKSGRIHSYIKYLPQIADFFGVSVDYLLGKEEPTAEDGELQEYLEELKNRPEMRMLFSLAKGATKEDVEQAVAIIEALRNTKNG